MGWDIIGILKREVELCAKCTMGNYVKMVEAEVDEIIILSTQEDFGLM